jgi:hypothetical protein
MPANAGIQEKRGSQAGMDPGLRRDDGDIWKKRGQNTIFPNMLKKGYFAQYFL